MNTNLCSYDWLFAQDDNFDYRQTTMTADEYAAALFLDSVQIYDQLYGVTTNGVHS